MIILPGTGRGTSRRLVEGQAPNEPRVPLHHASHGPPLPMGEDL